MTPITITLTLSTEALLLGHELVSALRSVAEAMGSRAVPAVAGGAGPVTAAIAVFPAEGAAAPAAGGSPAPIPSPPQAAPPTRPRPVTPAPEAIGAVSSSQTAPVVASVPPAAFSPGRVWTEERKAIVRRDWPAGVPVDDVRRKLEATAGGPVPNNANIGIYASGTLGVRRPVSKRASDPPPPPPPAPPPQPAPALPKPPAGRMDVLRQVAASRGEPVRVDFLTVSAWAAPRGLRCDTRADLPAVNAKRVALGLAPFVLPDAGGRV